jgi:hypothetical protein
MGKKVRKSRIECGRIIIRRLINVARETGLSQDALEKIVSAAYPWGQRSGYPYQAWLKAKKYEYRFQGIVHVPEDQWEEECLF